MRDLHTNEWHLFTAAEVYLPSFLQHLSALHTTVHIILSPQFAAETLITAAVSIMVIVGDVRCWRPCVERLLVTDTECTTYAHTTPLLNRS